MENVCSENLKVLLWRSNQAIKSISNYHLFLIQKVDFGYIRGIGGRIAQVEMGVRSEISVHGSHLQ
jgi:hypothetical protein